MKLIIITALSSGFRFWINDQYGLFKPVFYGFGGGQCYGNSQPYSGRHIKAGDGHGYDYEIFVEKVDII